MTDKPQRQINCLVCGEPATDYAYDMYSNEVVSATCDAHKEHTRVTVRVDDIEMTIAEATLYNAFRASLEYAFAMTKVALSEEHTKNIAYGLVSIVAQPVMKNILKSMVEEQ